MSKEISFAALAEERTRQVVAEIKERRLREEPSVDEQFDKTSSPGSEEFRNAVNGSIVGAIIGLVYGAATLAVIGSAFIPGILGACLILGYSALGGVIFGSIIGSTGLFASRRAAKIGIDKTHNPAA
jgi:hypothetical protein